jgi:hypothetical protein
MCLFTRNISNTFYVWDLHSLAAGAGSEYIVWKDGCNPDVDGSGDPSVCPPKYDPSAYNYQDIIFNVCGTVSTPIAEMVCNGALSAANCFQKPAPRPHSHGVAVQVFEKSAPLPGYTCVDLDTCDMSTNFDQTSGNQCGIGPDMTTSSVGSLNYPANTQENPLFPGAPFRNTYRENQCLANPNNPYCKTTGTPCTGQAEVLAYYDGSAPIFALMDETDPNSGVNISYPGALPYVLADGTTDRCPQLDPATGYQVLRYVNMYISCNKSEPGLAVVKYTERGQCEYFIELQSALACGIAPGGMPTPSAGPPAPPGAAAQPATALVVGTAFGGAFAGALAVIAALLFFRGGGAARESKQPLLRGSSSKLATTYGAVEAGGGGAGAAGWGAGVPQQAAGGGQGFCASCGAQRGPGGRFCGGCGQQFA